MIWKLHADNSLEPVRVALGITDHAAYPDFVAVLGGTLHVGDEIITGAPVASGTAAWALAVTDHPDRGQRISTTTLRESRVLALRGVSLAIEPGGFVAIMGASGSGKSSLMNILGCLDRPSSGRYVLDGTDVSTFSKRELAGIRNKKLGIRLSRLRRLLASNSGAWRTPGAADDHRSGPGPGGPRRGGPAAALAMVGLADRAGHFPSQMSGGQQQRVAIARALVNQPSILLADEPTGNLDSRTSVEIMKILQDLNDRGLTIVMVTHESDIAQFARRVIVFRDGRIRKDRTSPRLRGRPG